MTQENSISSCDESTIDNSSSEIPSCVEAASGEKEVKRMSVHSRLLSLTREVYFEGQIFINDHIEYVIRIELFHKTGLDQKYSESTLGRRSLARTSRHTYTNKVLLCTFRKMQLINSTAKKVAILREASDILSSFKVKPPLDLVVGRTD